MIKSECILALLLFFGGLFPLTGWSKVQLPILFNDHMVLQRRAPILVWGTATPGSSVNVYLDNLVAKSATDQAGNWRVTLPEMEAGGPFQLVIEGEGEKIWIKDILVGEVWLCSGQSNMQFPLERSTTAKEVLDKANSPQVRLFNMARAHDLGPGTLSPTEMIQIEKGEFLYTTPWQLCTPESVARFSAVAYHFGKKLADSLEVPIGLIHNAVGGSPIQAWMKKESLLSHPKFTHLAQKDWLEAPEHHPWVVKRVKENLAPWLDRGEQEKVMLHPFSPAYLFEVGIRPLAPFGIRGVIWYQGESNATHPSSYRSLFELMLKDWRSAWHQPALPFLFVQLPRIGNRSRWPEFRQEQQKCLEIEHTGMVVAIDEGHPTDVHPKEKKVIGERLGNLALASIYQYNHLAESPVLDTYRWLADVQTVELSFLNGDMALSLSYGTEIVGFYLHGYRKGGEVQTVIRPSQIKLSGSVITLTYPRDFLITAVSYAWAPFPQNNLVNNVGLPLAPFRIELTGNN